MGGYLELGLYAIVLEKHCIYLTYKKMQRRASINVELEEIIIILVNLFLILPYFNL